jgi:hypothetical protein
MTILPPHLTSSYDYIRKGDLMKVILFANPKHTWPAGRTGSNENVTKTQIVHFILKENGIK